VELVQFLGEVDVVEAHVGGRHERDDLRAQRGGQSARRRLAAAPMPEALQAVATEPRLEALELAHGQSQRPGPFLVRDLAGQRGLDEAGAWHFLSAHREGLHEGRTFSRSS
jgi:hypothetical protein